jgi:hypothetical protein
VLSPIYGLDSVLSAAATSAGAHTDMEVWPARYDATLARYHLDTHEVEGDRPNKVLHERVYKDVRMRVRYTCHNCSTTFGRDRVCVGCQHPRCGRCSRYPPKKRRPKTSPETADLGLSPPQEEAPRPTDAAECHECHVAIQIDVEECPNCHHQICDKCLHQTSVSVESSEDTPSQRSHISSISQVKSDRKSTGDPASTAIS